MMILFLHARPVILLVYTSFPLDLPLPLVYLVYLIINTPL
jgi:hypothetical protein